MVCKECGSPACCSVTTGENRQKMWGLNNSVKLENLTVYYCWNCVQNKISLRALNR